MRGSTGRMLAVALLVGVAAGFLALGQWQLERRAWKLALIAIVEDRIHREPVAAPGPDRWADVDTADDGYRPVRLEGRWLAGRDTFVQATTGLGSGFWLLTPLEARDGSRTLVNRGFVSRRVAPAPAEADVVVTGLLRISEPGGGFPRRNDPQADRWYSRDVAAIASRRGIDRVAPYFVDVQAPPTTAPRDVPDPAVAPVPGLTVVAFRNAHLVYALTWFGLAAMTVAAIGWLLVDAFRSGAPRPAPFDRRAGDAVH